MLWVRVPLRAPFYAVIVYRLGRKILNLQSGVRFPVAAPLYGLILYRLGERSFTAISRVRFPVGPPFRGSSPIGRDTCLKSMSVRVRLP
jgi:hypothetical protein